MTKPEHAPHNDWATGVYTVEYSMSQLVRDALEAVGCRVVLTSAEYKAHRFETDAHETTVNALVCECERAGVQR